MDWSRAHIESVLASHAPSDPWDVLVERRAAVAAVLRFSRGAPDVLLMQRTERAGDRWSGQVSFPGGRAEPDDPDLVTTAIRETREELGLDLAAHATQVGRLDGVRAMAHGKPLSMTVTPFVFVLEHDAPMRLCEREAAATFWLPLEQVASGALDATHAYRAGPVSLDLPCWRYEGRTVWGLTHGMIRGFLDLLRRSEAR